MNPLDELRDIQLPAPPGWWPPAPGWWLLAALLLVLATIAALQLLRRHRARAYRRAAMDELTILATGELELTQAIQLMRRTALSACARSPLAATSGAELLLKLDDFNGGRLASALAPDGDLDRQLATGWLYGPQPEALSSGQREVLRHCLACWIAGHRREDLC